MSDDIDELIDQLKNSDDLTTLGDNVSANKLDLNDENVNDFVMQKIGKLIEGGVDVVEAMQQTILASYEPDEITAFADVYKSVVKAADTLNKINLENKKEKAAVKLKEMDIKAKKELPDRPGGNTNILVATREEIIKGILGDKEDVIDITMEEEEDGE